MQELPKKKRYKQHEGKHWIEVRVKSPQQLFDARDPAPFRERDLDEDFEEYILSSLQDFSYSSKIKLIIHIESTEPTDLSKDAIKEAIQSYFTYKMDLQKNKLRAFLKRAQIFLLIGFLLLMFCLGLSQSRVFYNSGRLLQILREGIVIFGWVSIWKPIELVLFDWFPLFEQLRLYKKIQSSEVDVYFSDHHRLGMQTK